MPELTPEEQFELLCPACKENSGAAWENLCGPCQRKLAEAMSDKIVDPDAKPSEHEPYVPIMVWKGIRDAMAVMLSALPEDDPRFAKGIENCKAMVRASEYLVEQHVKYGMPPIMIQGIPQWAFKEELLKSDAGMKMAASVIALGCLKHSKDSSPITEGCKNCPLHYVDPVDGILCAVTDNTKGPWEWPLEALNGGEVHEIIRGDSPSFKDPMGVDEVKSALEYVADEIDKFKYFVIMKDGPLDTKGRAKILEIRAADIRNLAKHLSAKYDEASPEYRKLLDYEGLPQVGGDVKVPGWFTKKFLEPLAVELDTLSADCYHAGIAGEKEGNTWGENELKKSIRARRNALLRRIQKMVGVVGLEDLPLDYEGLPQVGGDVLDDSLASFERRCRLYIREELEKIDSDNGLIATLCDGVRLAREQTKMVTGNAPLGPDYGKLLGAILMAMPANPVGTESISFMTDSPFIQALQKAYNEVVGESNLEQVIADLFGQDAHEVPERGSAIREVLEERDAEESDGV